MASLGHGSAHLPSPRTWRLLVVVVVGALMGDYFIREIRLPLALAVDGDLDSFTVISIEFSLFVYPVLGAAIGLGLYALAQTRVGKAIQLLAALGIGLFLGEYWYQEEPILLGESDRLLLYTITIVSTVVAALLLRHALRSVSADQSVSQKILYSVIVVLAGMLFGYMFYFEVSPIWMGIGLISQLAHVVIGGYLGIVGLRLMRDRTSTPAVASRAETIIV